MNSELARWLGGMLARRGVWALAVLPIPPEILLPFVGFQVGRGVLGFAMPFLIATSASVLGALPLYLAARIGGRPLLLRRGRLLGLDERRLARAERWFERHGERIVLFGRMITGARSVVSVPAGLARMPVPRFLLYTALGFGGWNALLITAGWLLGDRWERVSQLLGTAGPIVAIGLAVAVVLAFLGRRWWTRRRASASLPCAGEPA